MNKLLAVALLATMPFFTMAQNGVIENPEVGIVSAYTIGLVIEKVEYNKKETKLYAKTYHGYAEGWMRISSDSYIVAGDKKLKITKAEGINFDEHFLGTGENFTHTFTMFFPPIDKNIEKIDFIESDCPNCFRIWDIPLTQQANEKNKTEHQKAQEEFNNAIKVVDDGKPLPQNKFALGETTLKVRLVGYHDGYFGDKLSQILCYINNPITGKQENYYADFNLDNTLEMKIPLVQEYQTIGLQLMPILNITFLASINGTEELCIDLNQYMAVRKAIKRDRSFLYFTGDNADINTVYNNTDNLKFEYKKILNFNGKTIEDYKTYVYSLANIIVDNIDNSNIPIKAKEYAKINLRGEQAYYLIMCTHFMEYAYRHINNIDNKTQLTDFEKPIINSEYYKFVKDLNLNDIQMLYSNEYFTIINSIGYRINEDFNLFDNIVYIIDLMKKDNILDENGIKVCDIYKKSYNDRHYHYSEEESNLINEFYTKYNQKFEEYKQNVHNQNLEAIGFSRGILFDLMKVQPLFSWIENRTFLTDEIIDEIKKIDNPLFVDYAKQKNAELLAKIEAEKLRGGYYVHQSNETDADAFLVDILQTHKGKVVYIDFWATWCGPCRMGIQAMKKYHDELAEKGVDFIYITNQTSPEPDFNNMILEMKGDHYRVSDILWNNLEVKLNIQGIPHYLFINKKGEISGSQSGFGGVDNILSKLEKLLSE